ncbi:hypothetical protein [Labrenzia sp. DG1229]|uniref:hypothetical protein n=1 Tax=Labrenzia sp. DG1229 TaxID=681847 RepID=UPI0004901EDF|nr:hypothetical protein [Labrenzia sp. DG1229]
MSQKNEEGQTLTEEGRLVVQITKVLFANDADETFRVIGRYMDKHGLKVSRDVIAEFELAGRVGGS